MREQRLTRRQLLEAAGGVAGALATADTLSMASSALAHTANASAAAARVAHFNSRPDLRPPTIRLKGAGLAPGFLFMGPSQDGTLQTGPLITDTRGHPIWFRPVGKWATNFAVRGFLGQDVLTWWQGNVVAPGFGIGEGVIVDRSYRELARIRAANGRTIDLHELQLARHGRALFICRPQVVQADLSSVGGPRNGSVYESIIQEVDVRSGRLLWEWRSLDHIPVSDSQLPLTEPYDYLHINSIDVAPDGNLIVSGRHAWTIYKLDRRTGHVIWRLGGPHSNFSFGPGTRFHWQHDARLRHDGSITVFDNGSDGHRNTEPRSRALVLDVDYRRHHVTLRNAYEHHRLLARAMGNFQTLPDGHAFINWGDTERMSEFDARGRRVADVMLPEYRPSYRGYQFRWKGLPQDSPAIVAARPRRNRSQSRLYVSWNGATHVTHWQVLIGSSPSQLAPAGVAAHNAFETAIRLPTANGYAAVNALDRSGRRLGTSRAVRL